MVAPSVASIETMTFENVGFAYEESKPVFTDMSFDVPMGKNILVTGPPGNGQSTFLKLLAVLLQPQNGRFFINGHDTTAMGFEEFLTFRMKIGYSFDYGGLFANRTLHENLVLPLLYHKILTPAQADMEASKLADHFCFHRQAGMRPASVSGGLRKLVCVLRAFMLKPELIIMDDPFTGLDAESVRKLIRMVHEKRESGELRHVFFTSRDEVYPERLGYEPLLIEQGQPRFGDGVGDSRGKAA